MTVETQFRVHIYSGNGLVTDWPIQFEFLDPSHIYVERRLIGGAEWDEVSPATYNVVGTTLQYPLFDDPLPSTDEIRISRRVPFVQTGIDLDTASGFDPRAVERAFDLAVMRDQQLRDGDGGGGAFFGVDDALSSRILAAQVEDLVQGVTMIPGSTAFGYGTTIIQSSIDGGVTFTRPENNNAAPQVPDFAVSLGNLRTTFPNCRRILLVVAWFGNDLRVGQCLVRPMQEGTDRLTAPRTWVSGGVPYGSAAVIPEIAGRPIYGSSPDDESLVEAIKFMKSQGFDVVVLPFILMTQLPGNGLPDPYGAAEQAPLPWRGRITVMPGDAGTAAARTQVNEFFDRPTFGYRAFILHLAQLCLNAGGVYGFCVGSELVGITSIRDNTGAFPGVEQLTALVQEVKALGAAGRVGYAADWTEYHAKWFGPDFIYNMDPLWAVCDFVGMDDYMPLADWRDGVLHADYRAGFIGLEDPQYIEENIEGGELYDWFYASPADRASQTRTAITDGAYDTPAEFRFKDIRWWWRNLHFNRINGVREATPTAWVPRSKSIWLTEFGVPSVDKGANQPNVFYTSKPSAENALPFFSNGTPDFFGQRTALGAKLRYWLRFNEVFNGVQLLDTSNVYIWTWDARPYPAFPRRQDVWADGGDWRLGHWLTGKYGMNLRLGAETRAKTDYDTQLQRIARADLVAVGGSVSAVGLFPAGSVVLGAEIVLEGPVTGPTTISLGIPGNPGLFGTGISPLAGSRSYNPVSPFPVYAPTDLLVTFVGAPATSGFVRLRGLFIKPLA